MASTPRDSNYVPAVQAKDTVSGNAAAVSGINTTNAEGLAVAVIDATGNQITTFGGGTQYADGASVATPTGNQMNWNNSGVQAAVSPTKPLPMRSYDLTASGGLTATSQAVTLTLNGAATVGVQLSGTWSGQVTIEATIDGSDWFTVNLYTIDGGDNNGTTQTGNGQWWSNVSGYNQYRVRCSSYTSGTINVNLQASLGTRGIQMFNQSPPVVNVGNFGVGQFGNQDGVNAGITSSIAWSGNLAYSGSGWDRIRIGTVVKNQAAVSITAGTPVAAWTPASGKKFRILGFALSLSVAGEIIFKDGTTEILRTPAMAAGIGLISPPMGNGIISTTANNVLNIDASASGTVNGYIFGVEE